MESADNLKRLKTAVEEKIGRKLDSPANFNYLSDLIQSTLMDYVSVSTLKRIWGYVSYSSSPTKSVLSILSRFVGYPHWDAFCDQTSTDTFIESMELTNSTIYIKDLLLGDNLEIEWPPNRYCKLECIGLGQFRVIESRNSKLKCGDTFKTNLFAKGLPLYVTDLTQNGIGGKSYVAGTSHGLSSINIIRIKKL